MWVTPHVLSIDVKDKVHITDDLVNMIWDNKVHIDSVPYIQKSASQQAKNKIK